MTIAAPVDASTPGGTQAPRRRRGVLGLPYWLLAPGILWLTLFFVVPMVTLVSTSLQTGDIDNGYQLTWHWANYSHALSTYGPQFVRSLEYAGIATVAALLIGYPLAYTIAFKAGVWKNFLLVLVIAPFFTSFLIRTLAWETILADNGFVVRILRDVHLVSSEGRLLATPLAVVCGLTYNFLPFMVLPLYAALERIDGRLIEAATDLYASRGTAFRKVTLPLALPGVFAGSLLTFIPAVGDFINAALLGTPNQYMVGNVIQAKFLNILDYPTAAALSFLLMGVILVAILLYARALGTRSLTEAAAA